MLEGLFALDESQLSWAWQLGKGIIRTPDGDVWDLDADEFVPEDRKIPWDVAVSSLSRYLSEYQPAVIANHKVGPEALGLVKKMRVLSQEEASQLLGIRQAHSEAIYFGMQLTDEYREKYNQGAVPYMSPRIFANYPANNGDTFELATLETSFTTIPVQQIGQPPTTALIGAQLSYSEEHMENKNPEKGMEPKDEMAALMAAYEKMSARLEAIEKAAEDEEKEGKMAADEGKDKDVEERLAALEKQLEATMKRAENLEAEADKLRDEDKRGKAEERMSMYDIAEDKRESLLSLAVSNPAAFEAALSVAPMREDRAHSPVARTHQTKSTTLGFDSEWDLNQAVRNYMSENGCTYSAALSAITTTKP